MQRHATHRRLAPCSTGNHTLRRRVGQTTRRQKLRTRQHKPILQMDFTKFTTAAAVGIEEAQPEISEAEVAAAAPSVEMAVGDEAASESIAHEGVVVVVAVGAMARSDSY